MSLIFVDVEATASSPFSGVMTEFGAVEFSTQQTFHGILWEAIPSPLNPAKPMIVKHGFHNDEEEVLQDFTVWISRMLHETKSNRAIFVSDNPAYDFQWINYYFDKFGMTNPFGHSGRRIGDFWAGLERDFYAPQKWKEFRISPHDHNPVHDARGNVEAFAVIMSIVKFGGDGSVL